MMSAEIQAAIEVAVNARLQTAEASAENKIKDMEMKYKNEIEILQTQIDELKYKSKSTDDKPTGIKKIVLDKSSSLKPESFENESKGKLFRHWAKEYKNWMSIIDLSTKNLMDWAETYGAKRIGPEELEIGIKESVGNENLNVQELEDIYQKTVVQNGYLHFTLMSSTGGEAKETVRSCESNGIEAWRELNYRWNRKTTFGATQVAELVRKVNQAKNTDEIYGKVNQLSQLYIEYEKHTEEIKDSTGRILENRQLKYHEVFKKSDLLRVVPEEVNRFLKRDGVDLETEAYQSLLDRVHTYIRNNGKGQAEMDINNILTKEDPEEGEKSSAKIIEDNEKDYEATDDYVWGETNYMGEKGSKGKGYFKGGKGYGKDNSYNQYKGKGEKGYDKGYGKGDYFNGECGFCGKWGHKRSQCRSLTATMKGKGKGYTSYNAKG